MTIKVRKKSIKNKDCYIIYINKITKKIRDKAIFVREQEIYRQSQLQECYRATINHELRTPLWSCVLVVKNSVEFLKTSDGKLNKQKISLVIG